MPLATQTPTLHKGPAHPGPAVTFALRGPKDGLGLGQRRKKWDDRHQVLWSNDTMAPNMRSYFDRFVDRMDVPIAPRRQLRPTWVCDVPEKESEDRVYRIFNARSATFEDQTQWANLPVPKKPGKGSKSASKRSAAAAAAAQSTSQLSSASKAALPEQPRQRTPRTSEDLKWQRCVEKEWDKYHSVVFSRFNDQYQVNVRSYFDRWKEDEGKNYGNPKDPTWRLPQERKVVLVRTLS
eukprot:CAMPEP_0115260348 /NCGR_PEP_ID=MMETSP0270-20121206/48291_1 /TAXON_ID=71861 /ORGANISM="Scrippsiella trochoidea, Strain CCMP3099" /LENGTH=236 /DNA_ID=CAMNT_0002676181 /DNA_START=45 /DNA_END=751 /DNA_ORIENTATION=+